MGIFFACFSFPMACGTAWLRCEVSFTGQVSTY